MNREEIYTQTSIGETPFHTDRDSVKENVDTEVGESSTLKELVEVLEMRN